MDLVDFVFVAGLHTAESMADDCALRLLFMPHHCIGRFWPLYQSNISKQLQCDQHLKGVEISTGPFTYRRLPRLSMTA